MENDEQKKVKPKNQFELDEERLATTDETGHRVYLYPEDTNGIWKNRRHIVYWILIFVYLVLPWIHINGRQAFQLNIFKREFTLLGYTWFGVEPIVIFLSLVSIIFFIAFMTSIFGRIWCGWGCPQTVFIQTIFLKIEKLIEGSARKRREMDNGPLTAEKFVKKVIKWTIFAIIASHIAHTFMGYLVGTRELFNMTMNNPMENKGFFIAVSIFTAIILLDFGWFREQFCIIACPYGRMQSVLMDNNSLVVAYDTKRGEPRRGNVAKDQEGDCINCYHCVKVCPTGIDIRRGTQLECIACTNCIDACDEVMEKIHKPKGLIKYTTENELRGEKLSGIRVRSIIYIALSLVFISSLAYFISNSGNLKFQFYRGTELPYQIITNTDGTTTITNHFTLKATYQGGKEHIVSLMVQDQNIAKDVEIVTVMKPIRLNKPETKMPIFFKFNPRILDSGRKKLILNVIEEEKIVSTVEVPLVGPSN